MAISNPLTAELSATPGRLLQYAGAMLASAVLAILTVQIPTPLGALAIVFLALLAVVFFRPETGLLIAVAIVYLNLPVIVFKFYAAPQLAAAAVPFLLLVPAMASLIARRQPLLIDPTFLLMLVFFGAVLLSSFAAIEKDFAIQWIGQYVTEGLLLYLFMLNLVRTTATLRRLVAALVIAGAVLGALSIYQEITGSYEQTFGGLAQRNFGRETEDTQVWDAYESSHEREVVRLMHRAQGPIGDPNRFAQILLVLLPLAWWQVRHTRRLGWKIAASVAAVSILGGIMITYSRGAFITLVALLPLAVISRFVRWKDLLLVVAGLAIVCLAVAPGYLERMNTLRGLAGLYSPTARAEPDAVQRGRATEMLGAAAVFRDHPLIGVGPGQYSPVYSVEYMNRGEFKRRIKEQRRAHSLYLELAAETGVVGLAAFLGVAGVLVMRLGQVARRCRRAVKRVVGPITCLATAHADLAFAFLIGISGYLMSAVFLHFSYQRYYWLFIALAGAAVQVLERESRARAAQPQPAGGGGEATQQ